ncbi:hypothetical protein A3K70_01510 [Candidatus Bathyarchaeota archaeon RBG_16_48_13]|nr:MAG: hypothetical protein A3K70_01510 [Candidatus Bathyarchaeota archaeon RBG_16_48_13]
MTSFESFFSALKKSLDTPNAYEVWPDFEPHFEEQEYAWTTLRSLGEVLLLNCGSCDGPSDTRHNKCRDCADHRTELASQSYQKATSRPKQKWNIIVFCRIYSE